MHDVTLVNAANGAAQELFQQALERVLENIADPGTDPTKKRQIILKFEITSNHERNTAKMLVFADTKLVGRIPVESPLFLGAEDGPEGVRLVARQQDVTQPTLWSQEE